MGADMECYSPRERLEYLRRRPGCELRGVADALACVRGKFAPPGLESELAGP